MTTDTIDRKINAWAATRRLPDTYTTRWLALSVTARTALLETVEELRLRTGQFVTVFELIEEIALRQSDKFEAILADAQIRRIIDGAGSTPDRARKFIEHLRASRFPRLKRAADRLAAEVASLALPRGISVLLPRNLSSDELRIEIAAHTSEELGKLIDVVAKNRERLQRVADALGGADEI